MAQIKTEISLVETEKFRTLILLLKENICFLPKQLASKVDECLNSDVFYYGNEYIDSIGIDSSSSNLITKVNGKKVRGVVSINPYLKSVKIYPSRFNGKEDPELNKDRTGFVIDVIKPNSAAIYHNEKLLIGFENG